jgi:hypothetical protein
MNEPSEVPVMTFQSWTFTYTAGRAGIKPGGVRLGRGPFCSLSSQERAGVR